MNIHFVDANVSTGNMMNKNYRLMRKSYAMQRMGLAIERAVTAGTGKQKERAARWAAAWGLLCGINTSISKLKPSDVMPRDEEHARAAPLLAPTEFHIDLTPASVDAHMLPRSADLEASGIFDATNAA